jgi:hypothetical protein
MTAPSDNMRAQDLSDSVLFGLYALASADASGRSVIRDELERRHPALREQLDAVVLQFPAGAQ